MQLIDGQKISQEVLQEVRAEVAKLGPDKPSITFIQVGENPASTFYVNKKQSTAKELGIHSNVISLPENVSEASLLSEIDRLNNDPSVNGILVQAPLPSSINTRRVFNHVHPDKDVDGFTSTNLGRLCQEDDNGFIACTPAGIMELFKHAQIETEGRHIVILGRSLIVGKPMALLLTQKNSFANATVTLCHSRTKNLENITRQADILIAAMGKPHFVKGSMIKEGAIVIDVGINRIQDPSKEKGYRLVGDVDFDEVAPLTSKITPVPGGVGPMTIAMLMKNTLKAFKLQPRN